MNSDLKVNFVSSTSELSQDPAYLGKERKKNILRWDVQVPAGAIGPKAFTIDYKFTAEFAREMSIAGLPEAK